MSKKSTPLYTVVDNAVTVLFVGGSHGNEQSGSLALQKHSFQRRKDYKGCKIVSVPNVNPYGIERNIRRNRLKQDLNRFYGASARKKCLLPAQDRKVINLVEKFTKAASVVVDFHETPSKPRSIVNTGIGHTIISDNCQRLARVVVDKVNQHFSSAQQLVFLGQKNEIKQSLRNFCHIHDKPYILIELSKSIPKQRRVQTCTRIIDEILKCAYDFL